MGKVKYHPEQTIEEISRNSGVSEATVRKYIRENFIDRNYDSQLIKYRRVQQYFKGNPDASITDAVTSLGNVYSQSTVEKYRDKANAPKPNSNKIYLTLSDPTMSKATVATVSNEDRLILGTILRLYLNGEDRFDCDLTFSKGSFYRFGVHYPRYCFDLYPKQPEWLDDAPEVKPLKDGYDLPDNSLSSIVIDLPQNISEDGIMNSEAFQSISHLALSYYEMLRLAYQKLRYLSDTNSGGLLIVKVGDIMWNGKMIWMSNIVRELATGRLTRISDIVYDELRREAEHRGVEVEKEFPLFDMELVDKYVHTYKPEEIIDKCSDGHSVKAHDYFLVFRKSKECRNYDIFYFGVDIEIDSLSKALDEFHTPIVVSRKSKAIGSSIFEVRLPLKNNTNCIDKQSIVSRTIINRISQELGVTIPAYAYLIGEKFLKYLKEIISNRILEASATQTENRKLPTQKQINDSLNELLRICGIKYVQRSAGDRQRPQDCYRCILDKNSIIYNIQDRL